MKIILLDRVGKENGKYPMKFFVRRNIKTEIIN
jgi:hypothetical protein